MQRVTISIDDSLAADFDALTTEQGYVSRSEAMRDLVRRAVDARRVTQKDDGHCVANLSFVYNHDIRLLAQRLVSIQHAHHDVVVSAMHVHLDHEDCLETLVLRGPSKQVRALADAIKTERGVRFAEINLIGVRLNDHHLEPDKDHSHIGHSHYTPHPG